MPLYLILIPYAVFLAVFIIFALVDLANLWRYRSSFFSAGFLTIFFLVGTAIIAYGTYSMLAPVNWTQTFGFNLSFTVPAL